MTDDQHTAQADTAQADAAQAEAAQADAGQHLPEELAAFAAGRAVRLRIVRHAETEHNINHLMQGWSDSPITEPGHRQIAAVARHLAQHRFDLAFSSDLQRTRTTAEGILAALDPQPPIEYSELLREWNFGAHEERPAADVWQEVIVEHGFEVDRELSALRAIGEQVGWRGLFDTIAKLDSSGQAEQAAATVMRADAALEHVIRAAGSAAGEGEVEVLIVSHGGFITSLLRQLVPELTPDVILPNCSISTVSLPAGTLVWQLDGLGEVAADLAG
ncbi:histidine phosphatase family protein [Agrococcus sp. ARC_14]|uniref:histidine phosphatase family protein n=1 Tax=Agrococcus sp. ARC_14 TaxID=2919927 RepID=UPI001F06AD09|nr:histidine phosphatase family protein [Agrococcus sp. ARC_14]MCH1881530.1 histidine phosphatase family protein [Agrococcus sp. ARC_14]